MGTTDTALQQFMLHTHPDLQGGARKRELVENSRSQKMYNKFSFDMIRFFT